VREVPKLELHLHLEGAAPPAFIRGLAAEKRVDLSGIFGPDGGYRHDGFRQFLQVYAAATQVLRTPADFSRLTRTVLEEQAAHGVIYTEIFLSPDFCGGRDLAAWRDHLAAIRETAEAVEREAGIVMRAVVTCIRHLGPDPARQAALCAAETAGGFVTGFGMGGDESRGAARDFAYAFDMAREAELGLTAHAGEWAGPRSVAETLDHLRVHRIGHGVRAIEDPALVVRLAESGTVLEVCPGSNVALGLCDWPGHPIERLRAAGVRLTVSTDDPPFFRTTMTREYERLSETFGWGDEEFRRLAEVAATAAFCDEATRTHLRERIGT
jgi:adenosine deaminase